MDHKKLDQQKKSEMSALLRGFSQAETTMSSRALSLVLFFIGCFLFWHFVPWLVTQDSHTSHNDMICSNKSRLQHLTTADRYHGGPLRKQHLIRTMRIKTHQSQTTKVLLILIHIQLTPSSDEGRNVAIHIKVTEWWDKRLTINVTLITRFQLILSSKI